MVSIFQAEGDKLLPQRLGVLSVMDEIDDDVDVVRGAAGPASRVGDKKLHHDSTQESETREERFDAS